MEKGRDGLGVSGSPQPEYPPGYEAANGGTISIPKVKLERCVAPGFKSADLPWIADVWAKAEGDLVDYRSKVAAGANPVFAARLAPAENAREEGIRRFGADGSGFLEALNSGVLWDAFWHSMFCFFGLTAQHPVRLQSDTSERIDALIGALPPDLQQFVLAQAFFPSLRKPRKDERLHQRAIDLLTAPGADLRLWEVGAAKIARADDMPDEVLCEIARSFASRSRGFMGFVAHSMDRTPGKRPHDFAKRNVPGDRPFDRQEALSVLEDVPLEKTFGTGRMVKSEANLHLTQAFHVTMTQQRPGIPKGHLMHLALSTKPNGPAWPRVELHEYRPDVAWPYVASQLDILSRALRSERLPWEPFMEPLKALEALTLLPALPKVVAAEVERLAKGGTVAQKKAAQALP